MEDKVSSELRAIEREINDFYTGNPQVKLPFSEDAPSTMFILFESIGE